METRADDARVDSPVARRGRHGSLVAYGFMGSQALFAALELGLFTELHAGPAPLVELARRLGCEPRALLAVLGTCVPCPMRALSG